MRGVHWMGDRRCYPTVEKIEFTSLTDLGHLEAPLMLIVNIHEAQIHLSRLIDQAVRGEPFIISKAGKPLVKVMAVSSPELGQVKRLGFMAGQITIPEDFDRLCGAEIGKCLAVRNAISLTG